MPHGAKAKKALVVVFHALEKKGMFTRQSINSILGDDWEWLSLGDRLTLVFMENPPLNAQPNAKARELGWPIRGPMVVVAADKDGEEDNVTRADIENLLATAKADLDRRASFARLPSDDNGAAAILTVTSVDESLGGSSPADEGAQDVCPNVNFELNPTLSTSSRKRKHDKEDHVHRQVAQRDNEPFVESSELSTAPTSSTSEPSTAATSSSSSSSSSSCAVAAPPLPRLAPILPLPPAPPASIAEMKPTARIGMSLVSITASQTVPFFPLRPLLSLSLSAGSLEVVNRKKKWN